MGRIARSEVEVVLGSGYGKVANLVPDTEQWLTSPDGIPDLNIDFLQEARQTSIGLVVVLRIDLTTSIDRLHYITPDGAQWCIGIAAAKREGQQGEDVG